MSEQLVHIRRRLDDAAEALATKKVVAGFDGFVDSIVRVVNNKIANGDTVFFETIREFGDYISAKSGSGFSLESEERMLKLGGNMPIMSNALAHLGLKVDCVGAFGVPLINPAFAAMHNRCRLHSFANPGLTTAMEFIDGKIMLAQMTDLNHADWGTIKAAVGLDKLKKMFADTHLISLVNWSELDHSNNIWEGLINDVLGSVVAGDPHIFIDLADCSKRSPDSIKQALALIKQFATYGKVTLGMNRNEAGLLYQILYPGSPTPSNLEETGTALFAQLGITTAVIHSSTLSLAIDAGGVYTDVPQHITNPTISTGAGDNFNAGYCLGILIGLSPAQALVLANGTSNCYIKSGLSPDRAILSAYLSQIISASL